MSRSREKVNLRCSGCALDGDILFVGMNPSVASPDSSPFHEATKSFKTLKKYLPREVLHSARFVNLSNEKIQQNKPLKRKQARERALQMRQLITQYNKVIAFGNVVSDALSYAEIPHFHMWHPSGLCRTWNDKVATARKIEELLEYIYGYKQDSRSREEAKRALPV